MKFIIYILLMSITSCASIDATPKLFQYDSIIFEIQPTSDNTPTKTNLEQLSIILDKYHICDKNDISFIINKAVDEKTIGWSLPSIIKFEIRNRHIRGGDNKNLTIFVAYLNGWCTDPNLMSSIGLAYSDNSFLYFIRNNHQHELKVLLHEFGHIIKLAHNRPNPVNPSRPNHCNNKNCVMYWLVSESTKLCIECQVDVFGIY